MHDEDTGEAVTCPFCGKADECDHLFALIDVTFGEIVAGHPDPVCQRGRIDIACSFAKQPTATNATPSMNHVTISLPATISTPLSRVSAEAMQSSTPAVPASVPIRSRSFSIV